MRELLVQSQARSRGKGSRADAKADAREKEEQAARSSREERSGGLCGFVPTQGPRGRGFKSRHLNQKSRHLNQKSEISFCRSPIFYCGDRVWMREFLVQSQARSRGKGSRADAKADAWEKGEQALFCQSPGGALTACELGNGTWNVPFPDRARTLPRETNKPPGQAARNAAADATTLFRRRDPAVTSTIFVARKSCKTKSHENNAFFMVICYFDFEKEKCGSYSIVLEKLMLEYK